jgi:hypothetical protein
MDASKVTARVIVRFMEDVRGWLFVAESKADATGFKDWIATIA